MYGEYYRTRDPYYKLHGFWYILQGRLYRSHRLYRSQTLGGYNVFHGLLERMLPFGLRIPRNQVARYAVHFSTGHL